MKRDSISLANVLGTVVVTALLATVAVAAVRDGDNTAPSAGCDSRPAVQVSTTPEFATIIEAAVDRLTELDTACTGYDVVVEPAAVAAQQIAAGTALPHVWIPDSEVWIARANESETGPTLTAGPTLATTPVLLAVPDSLASAAAEAQPWQQILAGPLQLRVEDPESSTAGLLTLASATAALKDTPEGDQLLLAATIRMSQERSIAQELLAQATNDDQGATAVATTEQQVARQRADNPDSELTTLVPAEGLGALTYSWIELPAQDDDAATRNAVSRLQQSVMGVAGVLDREAAGFRTVGDGRTGATIGTTPAGATPTLGDAASVLADWDAAGGDHQILTVIDASPSMWDPAGDGTRLDLVTAGFQAGLETIAPTAGVGLWTFSSQIGSARAWTELAPIAPQDAQRDEGGGTHQQTLLDAASAIEARGAGGTGLYDTVRAAYQAVQESSRSGFVSAVVVITDGREDEGLGLYQLLNELQSTADPDRRVPIYMVGVGPDVYEHELRLIAELTGGRYLLAPEPSDIESVIVDAMTRPYRVG